MPEKVPLWIIENTFTARGARFNKRGDLIPSDFKVCEVCEKELYKYTDWEYCDEKYYCKEHIGPVREAQKARWDKEQKEREERWRQERASRVVELPAVYSALRLPSARQIPRTLADVPEGNLEEFLYQFYVGTLNESFPRNITSTRAVCRACGLPTFGAMERAVHKNKSADFYTDGHSCPKVITLAVREMASLHDCFVCDNYTNKKHYGVPICSPNCLKEWKFNEKLTYPQLDMAISKYWKANATATGGSSTSESSSSQTRIVTRADEEE